jgi:V/A-type H+-transporting ATPase subunit E
MPETIESFVAKLQAEGVQAGQAEADKLTQQAREQADQILADARAQAEKIKADAEQEGRKIVERSQSELTLAARDAVLKLREALQKALRSVLSTKADSALTDVDVLGKTLHELVSAYSQSDCERQMNMQINVSEEMRQKLADWALEEIGRERGEKSKRSLDLRGTLRQAGFEYRVNGGTVEVTVESVVEVLSQMISPRLQDIVEQALTETDLQAQPPTSEPGSES